MPFLSSAACTLTFSLNAYFRDTYTGNIIFALCSILIAVQTVNETQNDSACSVTILVDLKQFFRKFVYFFFSISTNPNPRHTLLHDVTAYGVNTHTLEGWASWVHVQYVYDSTSRAKDRYTRSSTAHKRSTPQAWKRVRFIRTRVRYPIDLALRCDGNLADVGYWSRSKTLTPPPLHISATSPLSQYQNKTHPMHDKGTGLADITECCLMRHSVLLSTAFQPQETACVHYL